ncbi:MAG: hypothetical protein PHY77_08735 [Desulfotomaculaceae bacterium]|nr:hypothetical protein [Desulfotomaculaceae bacterium]
MIKKAPPPSVVYDFARQVWLIVKPQGEWIYHGDLLNAVKQKEIVCQCNGYGKGKIDIYEFDQMYGVGRCMECSKMHWYNLI